AKEKPPKGSEKNPKGSEKTPKGSKKPKEKPPKATKKPSGKKPPEPPSTPPEPPVTPQPPRGEDDAGTPHPGSVPLSPGELEEPPSEPWGLGREDWHPEPEPDVPEEPEPPTLDYNEQLEREDYEDFEYIRRQQKPRKPPSRKNPARVWPQPEEPRKWGDTGTRGGGLAALGVGWRDGDYEEGFEPPDYDDLAYGVMPPPKPRKHPDKEDEMETDEEKLKP
ncbi:AEBP1 protein, partial [Corythaixoides concolor]|nr:AEBP1 protein [Corythaixoides concolor]